MNIFNSLGSNYNLNFAIKTLLSINRKTARQNLIDLLEKNFEGNAYLFYKGRSAIEEGLKILNLTNDDCIAINGFTCYAVYEAIEKVKLKPFLIDIENDSLNFTPISLEKAIKINPKIKVAIIQNTLGYPCKIKEISEICKKNNIILIEDLAHSIGTKYNNGKEAGSFGDLVILSFSQDKIVDGVSGGALIIRNSKFKYTFKELSNPNFSQQLKDRLYPMLTFLIRNYYEILIGKIIHQFLKKFKILSLPMENTNYPQTISDWYCNLIFFQMKSLEENIKHRRKIAHIYDEKLSEKVKIKNLSQSINYSSNLRYPIIVKERLDIIKMLKNKGIYVSDIWYDAPIAPKRFMKNTTYKNECPISEIISDRILNLPTHRNISEDDAKHIVELINSWLK